ncbi:MAG: polysaccharide deacetylase family protein [Pirellulales bacterium]|nr:polysaccharide deacetylase family protein [Pirellulales bacterium]
MTQSDCHPWQRQNSHQTGFPVLIPGALYQLYDSAGYWDGLQFYLPNHRLVHFRRRLASIMVTPLTWLLGSRADQLFGILMYHRVVQPIPSIALPRESVTTRRFRQQMQGLLSWGYRPWPLRKILDYHNAGRSIPPKTFLVTFDDGYECIYHEAWPILRELAVPATVFVTTAYLDTDHPLSSDRWAKENAERSPAIWWRSLSTEQCAKMQASGLIELGSHSHTHADFRTRPEALRADLQTSLGVLRDRFRLRDATFAFPFGHCEAALAKAAQQAGMLCALTVESELVDPRSNPFTWGRFAVESYDTAATLATKLGGWYSLAQNAWYRLRRLNPKSGRGHP